MDVGEHGQLLGQLCERRLARNVDGDAAFWNTAATQLGCCALFLMTMPCRNGQSVNTAPVGSVL